MSLHLWMPGEVYRRFAKMAESHLDGGSDLDLCDAISHAKLKRRGRGFSVYVPLSVAQVYRSRIGWSGVAISRCPRR